MLSTTELDSQGDSLVQGISPAPKVLRGLTLDDERGLLHKHTCLVLGEAAEFPLRFAIQIGNLENLSSCQDVMCQSWDSGNGLAPIEPGDIGGRMTLDGAA